MARAHARPREAAYARKTGPAANPNLEHHHLAGECDHQGKGPAIHRRTWPWEVSPCWKDGVDLPPVQDPRQDQHRRRDQVRILFFQVREFVSAWRVPCASYQLAHRCRLAPVGKKESECTHEKLTAVSHAPAAAIALEKQAGPSSTSTRANIASS